MRFGISTHLFHDARLTRDHLRLVADHGFESVELFALRSHFDYHAPRAGADLAGWLTETGLTLHSVHAPIAETLTGGVWGRPWSNAAGDGRLRTEAVREAEAVLALAGTIPFSHLVLHVGVPAGIGGAGLNGREAARRSVEELEERAAESGVALALEVIPNELSSPAALVRLLDEELESGRSGICLDLGHAHLMGDVVDAVETVSGLLTTTHVHDNGGRRDEHLVPFEGTIDWEGALLALQKVGYEGVLMFELAGAADPAPVLARARAARQRIERLLAS
ncbi:MAG TPA: sugar phosphate isomerase/epimerase family protein [Vicinamibacterales bacterium]